ncbi:MAG: hypothetical protein H0Z33_08480 [Bacillaceae bacterium]|nr:hypothetical protein [Bacillaceae bacterium]
MIKRLKLTGSYREIGRVHGQSGKQEILQSLKTYEDMFFHFSKIDWKKAREQALIHVDAIENYDPDMLEEMQGIAEGAGVDFEDILVLNARSEIALANYETSGVNYTDGCTAIGVAPPISDDTIIGQNWDWKASQSQSLLFLEIEQKGKPAVKMVTEGGIIGKIGFNTAGVGVCLNALLTNKKTDQVPIHLGLRGVLNAESFEEAVTRIDGGQMASTANFLVAGDHTREENRVANIEVSPFGIDVMSATDGWITHTNHVCSLEIIKHVEDRNEYKFEDSMVRNKRATQLVSEIVGKQEKIDEDHFKTWFSDTYNYPNSISHYENKKAPEYRRMETIFSIIMNLTKQKMLLCVGKPSENPYVEV